MKRIALLTTLFLCGATLMLTGCSRKPPVLHTADQQAYQESYQAMTKGLDPAKKNELDRALAKFVAFDKLHSKKTSGKTDEEAMLKCFKGLEGMTANEIIETAQVLR